VTVVTIITGIEIALAAIVVAAAARSLTPRRVPVRRNDRSARYQRRVTVRDDRWRP
jgi:hypothetical protein